jgi:thiamine kinase-like enzyme
MLSHELAALSALDAEQLQGCLSSWPAWATHQPTVIKPLGEGLTNRSYLLAVEEQYCVLRVNTEQSAELDLQREVEVEVLRRAVAAGITPPLLYADPQHRFLLTSFVEGGCWSREQTASEQGLPQLAGLLNAIHRLPPVAASLDIQAKAEHYWRFIDDGSELAMAIKSLQPAIDVHLQAALASNPQACLCHNDLLADNILLPQPESQQQPRLLYAIDWEYAAMGDGYFDLAVVVEGHGLTDAQSMTLLAAYHGRAVTAADSDRLYHARVLYAYLSLLWYGVKYPRPDTATSAAINSQLGHCQALLGQCGTGMAGR